MGFLDFIPVIGSAVEAGLGFLTGNVAQKQEIAAQKEMQQASFKQQEYLLDKMNAYNTPLMQMKRYRDAGINPYVALGQISSGNQSSAGSVPSYPQRVPSGLRTLEKYNLVQQALSIAAQRSAIKKSNASAAVDEAQAKYIKERSKAQEYENTSNELAYRVNKQMLENFRLDNVYISVDDFGSQSELPHHVIFQDLVKNHTLSKLLNGRKVLLLDSLTLGDEQNNYASHTGFYNLPFVGNAVLDAQKKLADTTRAETLSEYQQALITSTLTTASLQQTLLSTRDEQIQQQIRWRYEAWDYLLNQEKFKAANLEERNRILQSTVEIMNNKAYYSSYNELMNAINNTVGIAAEAVGVVKTAVSKQRGVTNIRNQTNINNNNSFDGTIPY